MKDFDEVMLDKILTIEKDILVLKLSVIKKLGPSKKNIAKLKGIVANVDITDEDILIAKNSLYGKADRKDD